MKTLHIGILTDSRLIYEGIRSILQQTIGKDILCINLQDSGDSDTVDTGTARVIIADPMNVKAQQMMAGRRLDPQSNPTATIALATSLLSPEAAALYDATISIYDSPQSIGQTVLRLSAENNDNDSDAKNDLTPREKEIVVGIVKGLSNKEIAAEINVSVNTVMTHRRNIASKLQIHSPAGLTIYAIVSKLVSIDEIRHSIYNEAKN